VPPTRDRPGLLRVRLENRWRWHVVDPSLDAATAGAAVAELRRRNAGTNVGPVRRVGRYAPWLAFALVGLAGIEGFDALLDALALTEPLAPWGVGVPVIVLTVVAAFIALDRTMGLAAPDLPERVGVASVTELEDDVRAWTTDVTPAADVWRLNEAVLLCHELSDAYWAVTDLMGEGSEDETAEHGPAEGQMAATRRTPGRGALLRLESELEAALDELRLVAEPLGFPVAGVIEQSRVSW
jgi:hypothetical protein